MEPRYPRLAGAIGLKARIPSKAARPASRNDFTIGPTFEEDGLMAWSCAICKRTQRPGRGGVKTHEKFIQTW